MEIQDLRCFVAVVEHGGFRAAAEALHIAQSALSRRISRLEQRLGHQLLERSRRGVQLTPHGEMLLEGARRVLASLDDIAGRVADYRGTILRLGCAGTAAGSFLAKFLAQWIPRHPHVRLMMIEDGARALRDRLVRRECDLAIVASPIPPEFQHRLVKKVSLQALFPPGHRLAKSPEPLNVRELHRQRVLLNAPTFLSHALLMAACRVAHVEPIVVYESSVGQTLAALAEAGLGIAVVGDSVDLRGFDLQRRFICDDQGRVLHFHLHVAWLRDRILPPAALDFVDDLTKYMGVDKARDSALT